MLTRFVNLHLLEGLYRKDELVTVTNMNAMWQYNDKVCQVVVPCDMIKDGDANSRKYTVRFIDACEELKTHYNDR